MLDSLVPVDFFIISTSRIAHCMPGAVKLFQPGNPDFSQLKDFFLKKKKKRKKEKHPVTSPTTVPLCPNLYFWNLIYFCKTRQNWRIPQATNNSMYIVSFFPPLKVVFYLGQNLIEKPRFLWITWRQIIIAHTFRASNHLIQESI